MAFLYAQTAPSKSPFSRSAILRLLQTARLSGRRARAASYGPICRRMWDRIDEPPELLVNEIVRATLNAIGNWG